MLEIKNLFAGYGTKQVLFDVGLDLTEGEIVSIVGANGMGKTTLTKCISGLVRPSSGIINFCGDSLLGLHPGKVVEKGIACVPEGRKVFSSLTVAENLRMGAFVRRKNKQRVTETMELIYNIFPRLKERVGQMAGTLSGGEQQMLAVGRALMSEPSILLLDEPSLGIAPLLVEEIGQQMLALKKLGKSIIWIDQNLTMVKHLAEKIYVMANGSIVISGNPQDILNNDEVISLYLGVA